MKVTFNRSELPPVTSVSVELSPEDYNKLRDFLGSCTRDKPAGLSIYTFAMKYWSKMPALPSK